MTLDLLLISTLVRDGRLAFREAVSQGIDGKHFHDDSALIVFTFLSEYVLKYKDFPSVDSIFGKTGVIIPSPPSETSAFYVDELLNRSLHSNMGLQLNKIVTLHEAKKPREAYEAYLEGMSSLRKERAASQKTVSLFSLGPEMIELYDLMKSGARGILTPWPTINEATLGFWPEDLILFVARMGTGKTWALIVMATCAWEQGKRVLFATTEMSQMKIYQRWSANRFKLPHDAVRRGALTPFAEVRFKEGIMEHKDMDGFYVLGGDFDFKLSSLDAAVEECEPDIVLLDGAYLIKSSGVDRKEQAATSFNDLKRFSKGHGIPTVVTTQLNRDAKNSDPSSMKSENIALTDVAGWNADLIYALFQDDDMMRDRRMLMKALKFREGKGEDVECMWDFDNMNFSELPKGHVAAGGGAGHGYGPGSYAAPQSSFSTNDPYGTGVDDVGDLF